MSDITKAKMFVIINFDVFDDTMTLIELSYLHVIG